jgi:hypothetical protein
MWERGEGERVTGGGRRKRDFVWRCKRAYYIIELLVYFAF